MPDAGSVISAKVKAFAKDITKFLTAQRLAKEKELKKAGKDPDKILVKVSFEYNSSKGSISRTPQKQAEYIADGKSWTCSGAHMLDKARHVKMIYGAPGKKPSQSWDTKSAFGSKEQHFVKLTALQAKWKSLMSTHGLKNFKGKDGWGEGDAFHFELAESKVPRSDKKVQECLVHYARITRIGKSGKAPKSRNVNFENGSWKKDLKSHLDKIEKEVADKKAAERIAEIKAYRTTGTAKGNAKLFSSANKSGHAVDKSWQRILPPAPIDAGKEKVKKVSVGMEWAWDSLSQTLFEKLGFEGTGGFDVKLKVGVTYESVLYENLSQSFIRNIVPTAILFYDTPLSKWLKMTVMESGEINLKTSSLKPTGSISFDFVFTTPLVTEKGKIIVSIDGDKAKVTKK